MKRARGARAAVALSRAEETAPFQKSSLLLLLKSGSDDVTINHGDRRDQKNSVAPAPAPGKSLPLKSCEDKQRKPVSKKLSPFQVLEIVMLRVD